MIGTLLSALLLAPPAASGPTTIAVSVDSPEASASAPATATTTTTVEAVAPASETSPVPAPAAPASETSPVPAPGGETVAVPPSEPTVVVETVQAPAEGAAKPVYQPIMDPLPAPPAPVSRSKIRRGPWRGRWWAGLRIGLTGPLGGERPARPAAGAIGGGFDVGYRATNWLGIGTGISGQIHDEAEVQVNTAYGAETRTLYGNMIYWDPVFVRVFLPVKRRFQPFAEFGGGLASYERPAGGYLLGGQIRSGVGFDGWVSSNITLGVIANYRLTRLTQKFADDTAHFPIGHSYQVIAELGLHW
ncbi:MAG: hypothetical protein H6710_14920 [Myxococcales bacterium]|nr:hypothetical protein [Myxococcales bacterium]MCB9702032.1 hypothetical protein [Myxococcales bacterium]